MAGSVNKAIILGHLGKDPEIRTLNNGDRVANLSVATSESWKDKSSGERKEKTEWHRVTIFNDKIVEVAEKYLRKGSMVYIEGALRSGAPPAGTRAADARAPSACGPGTRRLSAARAPPSDDSRARAPRFARADKYTTTNWRAPCLLSLAHSRP